MAQLKLIMLDFDGTLVDTRRANALAYIETLSEVGIDITVRSSITGDLHVALLFKMSWIMLSRRVIPICR